MFFATKTDDIVVSIWVYWRGACDLNKMLFPPPEMIHRNGSYSFFSRRVCVGKALTQETRVFGGGERDGGVTEKEIGHAVVPTGVAPA